MSLYLSITPPKEYFKSTQRIRNTGDRKSAFVLVFYFMQSQVMPNGLRVYASKYYYRTAELNPGEEVEVEYPQSEPQGIGNYTYTSWMWEFDVYKAADFTFPTSPGWYSNSLNPLIPVKPLEQLTPVDTTFKQEWWNESMIYLYD